VGWALCGPGLFFVGIGRSLAIWIPAAIFTQMLSPLVDGSNQAIRNAENLLPDHDLLKLTQEIA
jgi:hypothetical protein